MRRRRGARGGATAGRLESRRPRIARRASRPQVSRMGARWAGSSPNPTPTMVFDTDTIAIVDGDRGFGQVIGEFATRLGIVEGRAQGHRDDRAAQLRSSRSPGRLGRDRCARQVRCRCISSTRRARSASRRSAAAIAGSRPIRWRSAFRTPAPIRLILDITTSTVAEGKLMVAMNKGEQVPEGWIVDKHGTSDDRSAGFLRRRRAADDRRAQGLGIVDRRPICSPAR